MYVCVCVYIYIYIYLKYKCLYACIVLKLIMRVRVCSVCLTLCDPMDRGA